jgi:hypothetical protein
MWSAPERLGTAGEESPGTRRTELDRSGSSWFGRLSMEGLVQVRLE